MNNVLCPHCGKKFEINEALKHQIEEDILREERGKHKEQLAKLKSDIEKETEKRIKEEVQYTLENSVNEIKEEKEKNKKLHEQLLEMNKLIRELNQKDELRELEMQKKIVSERQKMQEELTKVIKEKSDLEKAELQKKLEDTQKALEEAQRKALQTSQQLQGEVLELDLETQLRETFPTDDITPVPKGLDGADIAQKVKNKFGQTAGIIVWETKRTKSWSSSWSSKLREDKRRIDAHIAILVSDVLPEGIDTFGYYENIWVTCYKYALPLANVLRMSLFELAIAKSTTANKDERLEALFNYLVKDGFRNKFEAQVEGIITLRADLETEQRSTIRAWKKREMQLKRLMSNVATMYGELQGILGSSLPAIQSLDTAALMDGRAEQESLLE